MTDDELSAARASDLHVPRGLEAYVPALACLREAAWSHISEQFQILMELADYLGLTRTLELTWGELDELCDRLPGPLLNQAFSALPTAPREGFIFAYGDGRPWQRHMVIKVVAKALGKVNEGIAQG